MILALGGGVMYDTAGYVAATHMRGIPYAHSDDTSLWLIARSAGKTGIDTPYGKNLIGSYWQPLAVVMDTSFSPRSFQRHSS